MNDEIRAAVWPDAVRLGPGLVGPELVGRPLFGTPPPRWRRGRRGRAAPRPTDL